MMRRWPMHARFATAGLCGLVSILFWSAPWGAPNPCGIPEADVLAAACAQERGQGGSITKLRIEPLYRAARITWRAAIEGDRAVRFEIYRSQSTADGPYTLVASIDWKRGVKKYRYVDKNLPVEENYFYRIEIPETGENFGPLQVRPPFSLPTT